MKENPRSLKRRLLAALALNAAVIAAEAAAGLRVGSVGLLGDAGHNLVDQGALFMTLYAHLLSLRPASPSRTFGYHRAGILAALLNAFLLLLTAAVLAALALRRLWSPVPVAGGWVAAAALASFAANFGIAKLLESGAKEDLNIRGAFWHMLGDAWVSFGVAASGLAMLWTRRYWLDPLVSLLIVGVVAKGAWSVLAESLHVLMESAPPGVSLDAVAQELRSVPGVEEVHDLHLWSLKPGMAMFSAHLAVSEGAERERLLHAARARLRERFQLRHATLQLERGCGRGGRASCEL